MGEGGGRTSNEGEESEKEEKDPVRVREKSLVPERLIDFKQTLSALRQKG